MRTVSTPVHLFRTEIFYILTAAVEEMYKAYLRKRYVSSPEVFTSCTDFQAQILFIKFL
jgi:hypothetical protein